MAVPHYVAQKYYVQRSNSIQEVLAVSTTFAFRYTMTQSCLSTAAGATRRWIQNVTIDAELSSHSLWLGVSA
jgi:hypothetical protein